MNDVAHTLPAPSARPRPRGVRYHVRKHLGRGGMGEVALVDDRVIGRPVARKRLLGTADERAVARFYDEVRTVGSLEHPNIVPVHDVGEDEAGVPWFVMKYVEGETLSEVIARLAEGDVETHRRYPFERRLELFTGLLHALSYAHARRLVHRDVKPENLMVGAHGELMLMDWGIVHRMRDPEDTMDGVTIEGTILGTPQYMSPEQQAGVVGELDGRSDLYSAFATLWELLTLTPYVAPGATVLETLENARRRDAPSIFDPAFDRPEQPAVPLELRHFLRRGLRRSPADRIADAETALGMLERIRSGRCAVQCPVTFAKRSAYAAETWMDRYPRLTIAATVATPLALVAGLVAMML